MLALVFSAAALSAAPTLSGESPPGAVRVSGRILAGKGGRINPTSAGIVTPEKKVYRIVLDARGRSLVKVMHRESAEVWGTVSQKDGKDYLKVIDYVDPRLRAGHELWRRMRCNACVVLPATINAATPRKAHGAVPVTGRYYTHRERLSAWTLDGENLWVADDSRLVQISLKSRKPVRSFGRREGLPDSWIYGLASGGGKLWIVYRGGVARLDVAEGRIVDLPALKSAYARVHLDPGGAWVLTDKGTYRFRKGAAEPEKLPELTSAWRIAKAVRKGIWIPHWERRTGHFMTDTTSIGEKLFLSSYGSIHMLSGGKWSTIASRSWSPTVAGGRLWYLNAEGLNEYDPAGGRTGTHRLPPGCRGRCVKLLAAGKALWVAAHPSPGKGNTPPSGGGLARFDPDGNEWQAFAEVAGGRTDRIACLSLSGDELWCVALDGKYSTKSAHPGMTTTRRSIFETTGMRLLNFDRKTGEWRSMKLALSGLEKRLICGQDGKRGSDTLVPEFVERLSVGPERIFAATRLVPRKYFGGYWPCVNGLARRKNGKWQTGFDHDPGQLGLQGEQPAVLNISHGELTRIGSQLKDQLWEAVAQDLVLGLFNRDGTHWVVTDGSVGFFDAAAGKWVRVLKPAYRWYWRATATIEDGGYLHIGSDRGLIGRLEIASGRFEVLGALKNRSVAHFSRGKDGRLLLAARPAPLGKLPVFLENGFKFLDCEAAEFDAAALTWKPAGAEALPPVKNPPRWFFRPFDRKGHLDKTRGNFLCERTGATAKPRYYVKEVFFPQFLCEAGGGKRMWISTYTGLVRLELPGKKGE